MSNNQSSIERRNFLRILTGVAVTGCVGACLSACSDDDTSPVALTGKKVELLLQDNPTLLNVGGFVRKTFSEGNNGRPILIVRTSATSFRAMTLVCTHQGSLINNPTNANKVLCPNHGAEFSIAEGNFGKNVGGQSTSDLQTFDVIFDSTKNSITLSL